MAEINPEIRAAIHAFFRAWRGDNVLLSEASFTHFVDKTIVENRGRLQEALLMFHATHGRYPTFEEMSRRGWRFGEGGRALPPN